MKKRLSIAALMVLVLCLSLFAVGCGGTQSVSKEEPKKDAKPIELTFAGFMPAASAFETEVNSALIKEIEAQTGGRVKVVTYPGGTLLAGGKVYDGVAKGVADMGHEALSWVSGRFPVSDMLQKSGVPFESGEAATRTFKAMVETLNPKEFQDVKLLMPICTGPGNLQTIKPVRSLEDLKGMEIRCIGTDAPSLTALGAKPVPMSHADGYDALQKGIVQGTLASNETLKTWHTAEVTKYTTVTPFLYNGTMAIVMNLNKWNSLPKDIQEGIDKASNKVWEDVVVHFFDNECENGLKYAKEQTGQEVINLSEEETKRWKEKVSNIINQYAEDLNKRSLPGSEAKKLIFELGDKYNKLHQSK